MVIGPPRERVEFSAWHYAKERAADFVKPGLSAHP